MTRVVAVVPVVAHLHDLRRTLPFFAIVPLIKALFYAWPTTGRFPGQTLACPFCGLPGADRLEHILVCNPLLLALDSRCSVTGALWPDGLVDAGQWCLIEPIAQSWVPAGIAVALDALHFAYVTIRHSATRCSAAELIFARLQAVSRASTSAYAVVGHLGALDAHVDAPL